LLRAVRQRWPLVAGFAIVGATAGGITAVLLPSYYRSGAAFQAESATPPPISSALAGLASQIGGLQLSSQSNAQLFGDLITTDAVLRRVSAAAFSWKGGTANLASIYRFDDEAPGWREYNTVRKLRKAIAVDVSIRTGVVRFSVEARTPHLAQALAETTLAVLNQANIDLRQARAAAERHFTATRAAQARLGLDSVEQVLAVFYQRNRMIGSSPGLQLEEARLRRAVDMAQQVYVQLRMQEEQAALQEVRNTPAVSVIDPPLIPVKRARPNRRIAVALGLLIGVTLALVRLLLLRTNP
jgi:uncharacterized protein involved in exopolysaccharide biosynthesis